MTAQISNAVRFYDAMLRINLRRQRALRLRIAWLRTLHFFKR